MAPPVTRTTRLRLPILLGLAALLVYASGPLSLSADADDSDYSLTNTGWNGLSDLLGAADAAGVTVDSPEEIDVDTLGVNDALLVVYPTRRLPSESLGRFVRRGGRLAIADDFGQADEFFVVYGIVRSAPQDTLSRVRGNPELPLALPQLRHPLTRDVDTIVTNHPTGLRHDTLRPIIGFGEGQSALVLAGAVERGRLVSIGDPSILINNMLQFRDNRRFAENLLAYLGASRDPAAPPGRVYLVPPDVRLIGQAGSRDASLESLRGWLDDFAHADAPPIALLLTSLVVVTISLIFVVSSLPRRSPYLTGAMLGLSSGGGLAGRIAFFGRKQRELLHPLLVFKFELEGFLIRHLGLEVSSPDRGPLLREVLIAAEARGLSAAHREALRALLLELDDLRRRADLPPGPPRPSPKDVQRMVDSGERIVAELVTLSGPPHSASQGTT